MKFSLDKSLIRNTFYIIGGIIIFTVGLIFYGLLLNTREDSLAVAMAVNNVQIITKPNIVIERDKYKFHLYNDTVLVKTYRAGFGRNHGKIKKKANDKATPVGTYTICAIDSIPDYGLFFRLNYPNLDDANEALRIGMISQKEYDKIRFEFFYGNCINSETKLGGNIGIHGNGKLDFVLRNLPFVYNWTEGSVSLSNSAIEELKDVIKIGTKVIIKQ